MFWNSVLIGGFGGVLGQLGSSPLFLVKTHLQAEAAATIAVGHQHHHTGTLNALKTIYSRYGVSFHVHFILNHQFQAVGRLQQLIKKGYDFFRLRECTEELARPFQELLLDP